MSAAQWAVYAAHFTATYRIFLPGMWLGRRPRTSGCDRPPVHIDPAVAAANGFDRPILHGLCTLGMTARVVAEQVGRHPADLESLSVRLSAPVLPGETLLVRAGGSADAVVFESAVEDRTVLRAGHTAFPA